MFIPLWCIPLIFIYLFILLRAAEHNGRTLAEQETPRKNWKEPHL